LHWKLDADAAYRAQRSLKSEFDWISDMSTSIFYRFCGDLIAPDLVTCSSSVLEHRLYLPGDIVYHNEYQLRDIAMVNMAVQDDKSRITNFPVSRLCGHV
jgi:hypothetical protein